MSDQLMFNRKTSEVVRKPDLTTTPLTAIGWLAFTVLLLVSPAVVWAGWTWLL